jgi:DNA-binding SARP family transcriptional activator
MDVTGHLPPAWEPALRAVISKVRGALAGVGLDRDALSGAFGVYRLHLPPETWVDLEAAAGALHRAETMARAGQVDKACGWALAARAIGARPLLPGAEGPWVARRRARRRDVHLRSLEVLAHVWVRRGEPGLAVADAEEALRLEPFRESTYRTLMRAHTAAGNRAEAVRVYQRCRELLAEELGVNPSQETEGLYLGILRSA